MAALIARTVVLYDERLLWHLATGTVIRELGAHGRTFTADARTPADCGTASTNAQSTQSKCPSR